MAYDEKAHAFNEHGFMVDKETGVPVGLIGKPPVSIHADPEYPKWVVPHRSHIEMQGDHIAVPSFVESHIARDGMVTVLVHDAEHEMLALDERISLKPLDAEIDGDGITEAEVAAALRGKSITKRA